MIDLHAHSDASDGSLPPGDLPRLAMENGLSALALTDHDTVAGLPAFARAALDFPGLEAVPGIELSTLYCSRELHFVGLYIDPGCPELLAYLDAMQRERRVRGELIRAKLTALGYPISADELSRAASGHAPGRPHFARILVDRFGLSSTDEAFSRFLGHNAAAYVPRKLPGPEEAIRIIHRAGGVAVWAHPVYRERNERAWLRRILRKFSPPPVSLDAVEGYYSFFGPEETRMVGEAAENFGVLLSGGSDFHGANSAGIGLGCGCGRMNVPDGLLPALKERARMWREMAAAQS